MWKDRRGGVLQPNPPPACGPHVASKSSLSAVISTDSAVGVLSDTSATSFDDTGSVPSGFTSATTEHAKIPEQKRVILSSSPVNIKAPVRVVGRGGQGSRPRLIKAASASSSAGVIHRHVTETNAPTRSDSTRIVGRGGMGSRPRDLPAPAPSLSPPQTPISMQQPAAQPLKYRPSGRGGAGSKPRAPKPPPTETIEKSKSLGIRWKGKQKETTNATTYGTPSLSRTDSIDTTASSVIDFLPPRSARRIYQSTVAQDPIPEAQIVDGSNASVDAGRRNTPRLQRLIRTLGIEIMASQPQRSATPTHSQNKSWRRSSVSDFAIDSDSRSLSGLEGTDGTLRRRASFESSPSVEDWKYPKPPRPPPAFPDDVSQMTGDDDTQSEMLTYDASTDDHSDLQTISSTSTTPIRFHPHSLEEQEDEDYPYHWDRSPTPVPMKEDFWVPFQSLDAASSRPSLSESESEEAMKRDEVWTGEWNCADIKEVISSLRELRC